MTCSFEPGRFRYQPNCVPPLVHAFQQIALLVTERKAVFEVSAAVCCTRFEVEIDCGAVIDLYCVEPFEFHDAWFQSQMPYSDCVPLAYVVGEAFVCGICRPVPKSIMTCGWPPAWPGEEATISLVVIGWLPGVVNSGWFAASAQLDGVLLVRSKRQTWPSTSPA